MSRVLKYVMKPIQLLLIPAFVHVLLTFLNYEIKNSVEFRSLHEPSAITQN